MLGFSANSIQEPIQGNYFEADFVYTQAGGFNIAFGLSAYDYNAITETIDESYGRLVAYSKEWGKQDEDGNFIPTIFRPLKTDKCKEDDFNLNGDPEQEKYKFYQPAEQYARDTKAYFKIFQCIQEDIELMGDYNSGVGK